MPSVFTPEFFKHNREQLFKTAKADLLVVAGNGMMQSAGPDTYAFTQHSSFWYLSGVDVPDAWLVMTRSHSFLAVPERDPAMVKFEGGQASEELINASGVDTVVSTKQGWQQLKKLLSTSKKVATLEPPAAFIPRADFYANPAPRLFYETLQSHIGTANLVDVRVELARQRMVKQPIELAVMQHAIDITSETLREVIQRSYNYEYELEAAIGEGFRRRGASGHGFQPIVASGQHACTPHYMSNSGPIDKHGLTVLDVGAEVAHYKADISRTIAPVIASPRQQAVYDAVMDTYEWAKNQLKPGVFWKEYEAKVTKYHAKHLKRLGIITKMDRKSIREFYPHYTSHSLGLDTHDAADYDLPLAPNMVFTIEPGIYLPAEGIGVRVEDDFLITESGVKNMSQDLPRVLVS